MCKSGLIVQNKTVHLQGSISLKGLMGSGDTTGW